MTLGKIMGWVATALVVTVATSMIPEREAHAEPITITTGIVFGSTIGAGLPAGLSGLGAGGFGGAYAYAFATGGAVTVGAAVIAGIAIVGALAVGGYFLYKYIQKKRSESSLAAGTNVRREAETIPAGPIDRRGSPSVGGAVGAGMPR